MFRNGGSRRSFKGGRVGSAFRSRVSQHRRPRRFTQRSISNARIGGFLGIEVKFYDQKLVNGALVAPTDAAGGEVDPSATVLMNTVVQGDGESQRDGRKITMKSIYVEGVVSIATQTGQSGADSAVTIFIALVMDQQTNGATITSENVYTNPGANAKLAAGPFRNLQFTKRFKVLGTRKFTMQQVSMTNDTGSTGGVIVSGITKRFKFFKHLGNSTVTYTASTETVANIVDNSLHLIAYCSSTSMAPLISYSSRLRFVG